MRACAFCGAQDDTLQICFDCGEYCCMRCGPAHAKKEDGDRFVRVRQAKLKKLPSFYGVWRLDNRDEDMQPIGMARDEYRERMSSALKDTEGTPTPAAITPKVYRGGGGSPDEPPEGAGAPNRPRIEKRRQD